MYGLYGINHNIENIFKLAAPFVKGENIQTTQDLRPSYIQYLKSIHSEFPIDHDSEIFVKDRARAQKFLKAFSASHINDLNQESMVGDLHSPADFQENFTQAQSSLKALKNLNQDILYLLELAVHSIILCGSNKNSEGFRAHGGTTSKCIGLIWLNLKADISLQNITEMLIHELTHTLVFLDELNYGHFDYHNLTKKEFWSTSSILKRQRPMDKVVHSIVVSLELLYARQTYHHVDEKDLFHPDSQSLAASTMVAIDSILKHPRLDEVCLPRTIEIVENSRVHLLNL